MDGPYYMELDETLKPVVHPPRKVPVALRDRLKEELDKLVRESYHPRYRTYKLGV